MAETSSIDTFDVDVICPTCSERRYTSVRPLGLKETLTASLFKPVHDAPAMTDGQPLLCHECSSLMKFTKAANTNRLPSREEMVAKRGAAEREVSRQPVSIDTLFEVRPDEEVRDIRETPSGLVIITNKRIVRVSL